MIYCSYFPPFLSPRRSNLIITIKEKKTEEEKARINLNHLIKLFNKQTLVCRKSIK